MAAVVVEAVEGRLLLVAGARGCVVMGLIRKCFYYQKKLFMGAWEPSRHKTLNGSLLLFLSAVEVAHYHGKQVIEAIYQEEKCGAGCSW